MAEKPQGMRLKFVLSQLRTYTWKGKHIRFLHDLKSIESNPVNLGGVCLTLVPRSHSGRGRSGYEIRGRLKRAFKMHVKNTEKY